MKGGRGAVAEVAAMQWGLVTTAQAEAHGAGRMLLSRMASTGELERVMHGVYVATSNAGEPELRVRAEWIALEPAVLADDRLVAPHEAGVVSHASAAALHKIGDIPADAIEFTLPDRHRSRRLGTRFHRAHLAPSEITLLDGLPVTTPARTIADLLVDGHDMAHVADAVADILNRNLDTATNLTTALDPIAAQLDESSGATLLRNLLAIKGMDPSNVLERVHTSHMALMKTMSPEVLALAQQATQLTSQKLLSPSTLSILRNIAPPAGLIDTSWVEHVGKQIAEVVDTSTLLAQSVDFFRTLDLYESVLAPLRQAVSRGGDGLLQLEDGEEPDDPLGHA